MLHLHELAGGEQGTLHRTTTSWTVEVTPMDMSLGYYVFALAAHSMHVLEYYKVLDTQYQFEKMQTNATTPFA